MSLIPEQTTETSDNTEQTTTEVSEQTTDTQDTEAKFMYADGVLGNGDVPEWFKSDKYKNIAEQAKAYTELESKFGKFTGAPKDGKYEIEGVDFSENPLLSTVAEWGAVNGLSNDGLSELVNHVQELANKQIEEDRTAAISQLGENAEQRLRDLAEWGKNNLDADAFVQFQGLAQTAGQVEVLEQIIAKSKNSKLVNKQDIERPDIGKDKEAELEAMQLKTDENGRRLMDYDANYRKKVQAAFKEYYEGK